jgi:hypothetical protein
MSKLVLCCIVLFALFTFIFAAKQENRGLRQREIDAMRAHRQRLIIDNDQNQDNAARGHRVKWNHDAIVREMHQDASREQAIEEIMRRQLEKLERDE